MRNYQGLERMLVVLIRKKMCLRAGLQEDLNRMYRV